MKEDVIINLENKQQIAGGGNDCFARQMKGTLYHRHNLYYLVYIEQSKGLKGARTTLKINQHQNRVFLLRSSPAPLKQSFNPEEKTTGQYQVENGSMKMEIETDCLDISIEGNRGKIIIKYNLYLNGELVTVNSLQISYIKEGVEEFAD